MASLVVMVLLVAEAVVLLVAEASLVVVLSVAKVPLIVAEISMVVVVSVVEVLWMAVFLTAVEAADNGFDFASLIVLAYSHGIVFFGCSR